MSTNLHARTKKEVIDLWQTPTQISYTILPSSIEEATGKKAQEALERYLEWVHYHWTGELLCYEDEKILMKEVEEHTKYVNQFMKNRTLTVWVM
jgi:hypothetical protein